MNAAVDQMAALGMCGSIRRITARAVVA